MRLPAIDPRPPYHPMLSVGVRWFWLEVLWYGIKRGRLVVSFWTTIRGRNYYACHVGPITVSWRRPTIKIRSTG